MKLQIQINYEWLIVLVHGIKLNFGAIDITLQQAKIVPTME